MNWGDKMKKIKVGKVVNTHGIKGEIRILSGFQFKDKVFKVNNSLIIGDKEYIIKSYRVHKMFDMVTLDDYKDINEVLFLMKKQVYFDKDKLELLDYEVLDEDLLKYKVISNDGREGKILEVFYASPSNKVLRVKFDSEFLVPCCEPFVTKIDKDNMIIYVKLIDGLE